jgi:hypothetical protein
MTLVFWNMFLPLLIRRQNECCGAKIIEAHVLRLWQTYSRHIRSFVTDGGWEW